MAVSNCSKKEGVTVKAFLILVSVLISTKAMANPFSGFVGSYFPTTQPVASPEGNVKECIWLGFPNLNEIKVYESNGEYIIELVSDLNNSPLRSFVHLREYRHLDLDIVNEAKISGDGDIAKYTITHRNSFSSEIFYWEIGRSGEKAYFHMSNRRIQSQPDSYGCSYYVELAAQ